MKKSSKIPVSKISRASKLLKTGVKVGTNYLKYYGDRIVNAENDAKNRLNTSNASDIYDGLKTLKGGPLKLIQMLSMEKNILPQAYIDKFSLAQFSVPPLSPALVVKTFKKYFNKYPSELFDNFDTNAINAASIGQVHRAEKNGKQLAVKIQYPGVSNSIKSDIALVKPIAIKMFNFKGASSDAYFKEVENKLLEETDYLLEIKQSEEITKACKHLSNTLFPSYYKNLSSKQIITMDWMEGKHLSEFIKTNPSQETANLIGQTLWDFYMFQIHKLKKVHADPHPGNFLISKTNQLIALDFGCVKIIPLHFYNSYFELFKKPTPNPVSFTKKLYELELLREDDSKEDIAFFTNMLKEMLEIFTEPFHQDIFDFSEEKFQQKITDFGEKYMKSDELKTKNGNRGSKHLIYINRTLLGLYHLMFQLKATNINTNLFNC